MVGHELTIFYEEDLTQCNDLLDELWQEASADQTYDITVQYGTATPIAREVMLQQINQHIENGVVLGFNITFLRSA